MSEFKGKVALSTGAASGMGLLFSQNMAALGANIVMCDVNEEILSEKVNEINEKGEGRAIGVICDVRDYEAVCSARDKAVEAFGRIDILVNFAGGTAVRMCKVDGAKHPEFPDVPIEVYDWGIDVNLKGPFYFAHAVMKQMREQNSGLIVNIGSITGVEGDYYGMDYPTSKAGLMYGLTKSLAQ
ncbi:MAG: SDR family NAD(P)-dependent oxidoreductase, partial [Clostridia bacterium]|nr:SDR family NAD(P)-dependent oxidoreductase [Clostridia bacterium]